ncbi:ATP-binding protein [Nocardiopsis sp. RSe5-2]|uniref:ATP-binding protein n=1 Tax=Nocardiopsis endophytica TaxID=3018445 RepID=A0ABT4U5F8_9ACTN|nr:ATP-binding protein [Nocardiopsis endophytica]MDA2812188.1 ATP-binding protein [Nocardiopsis endophytica]
MSDLSCGPLVLSEREQLPCTYDGLRIARSLTRIRLRPLWADPLVDDAELCVDEAFCNARRHTRSGHPGGTVTLALYAAADGPLYIDLADAGPLRPGDRPRVRAAALDTDVESGRGMFLIDSLAAHWLYVPRADGGCLSLTLLTPDRAPLPVQG